MRCQNYFLEGIIRRDRRTVLRNPCARVTVIQYENRMLSRPDKPAERGYCFGGFRRAY